MMARLNPFQKKRMGVELSREDILVLHDPEEAFWCGFRYGVDMALLVHRHDDAGEAARADLAELISSIEKADA